jgi:hypothetical protein
MSARMQWIGALGVVLAAGCSGEVVPSGGAGGTGQTAPPSTTSGGPPPMFGSAAALPGTDAGAVSTAQPNAPAPSPPPPGPPPGAADAGPATGPISGGAMGSQPVAVGGGTSSTSQAAPPSQASLVTLAAGQTCPWEMAIDATSVYWTDCGDPTGGYVLTVPKAGGGNGIVALATGDRLSGIAVGGSNVYWVASTADASSGAIMTVPVGGGMPARVAPQSGSPSHLAVDSAFAYWSEDLAAQLVKAPLDGGAPTAVASAPGAFEFALSDSAVYWLGPQGLMTAPKTGGAAVTLASGFIPLPTDGLAVNGSAVFFTSGPPAGQPGVSEVAVDGGATTLVAPTPPAVGGGPVALDTTRVYWADMSGSVYAAPLTGGTATLLATGQVNVVSIAVDESAVYWLVNGNGGAGAVMKLPLSAVDWR